MGAWCVYSTVSVDGGCANQYGQSSCLPVYCPFLRVRISDSLRIDVELGNAYKVTSRRIQLALSGTIS